VIKDIHVDHLVVEGLTRPEGSEAIQCSSQLHHSTPNQLCQQSYVQASSAFEK